jgi:hypothetical protein
LQVIWDVSRIECAGLNWKINFVTSAAMNFFLACLAWLVIGILFAVGIWLLTVKGIVSVFVVVTIAFIVAVWKIGCTEH